MAVEKRLPNPAVDEEQQLAAMDEAEEFLIDALDQGAVDITETEDGGLDIGGPDDATSPLSEAAHDDNLADWIGDGELDDIGRDLLEDIKYDIRSSEDWRKIFRDGLEQLGINRNDDDSDFPFPDACKVVHPALMEAIIKYQSRARSQILPPGGPVKTKIVGDTEDVEGAEKVATMLRDTMNSVIDEDMTEYDHEHDTMLLYQGYFGSGVTKTYTDQMYGRPVTRNVRPLDFFVDYFATDLETAERYTELVVMSKNDMQRAVENEMYRDADIQPSAERHETSALDEEIDRILGVKKPDEANKSVYTLFESHVELDIGEGLLPYIVTLDKESGTVLSIYRNWDEGDEDHRKNLYYVHWPLIPGFGFYGFGYLHIIGGLTDTATKVLRQLIDAGTFSNFPGGFKAHGLRVVGDQEPLQPGEWREINAIGADLKRALMPMPYKEPSSTLVQLLEFVVSAAGKFADQTEEVISDSKNYGPVNTTLALMEAGGKMFTAIHERLFKSQRREIILIRKNIPGLDEVEHPNVRIIPVTDPRQPNEAHRLARTYAHFNIATQAPERHDMDTIIRDLHAQIGASDPDRYMKNKKKAKPPPPSDPISENVAMISGGPIKAYEFQDHSSHIKVLKMGILNNPEFAQNQMIMQSAQAHLMEHLAMRYKVEMEQAMGVRLPPAEEATPEIQSQIALQAAQVADKVLNENLNRTIAETREMQVIDPVLQLEKDKEFNDTRLEAEKIAEDKRQANMDDQFKRFELMVEQKLERAKLETQKEIARMKPKPASS